MSALLLALLLAPQDTVPPDTYADPATRALVERAMTARAREEGEVTSYEGTLRERIYVGFAGLTFRRERSLFQSERVARIRWERDGGRTIQWMGERNEVPILGPGGRVSTSGMNTEGEGSITIGIQGEDVPEELRANMEEALLSNLSPFIFSYRPGDDRLALGEAFALHPLADSAALYYRYHPGDTLRIDLPSEGRTLALAEVLVEPREARFQLLAASLWFDLETGTLARASYRPSRPYDVEEAEGESLPGFLSPVEVDFDYFTVESSLQEMRWWLPRRFGLEGEVRVGRILKMPLAVEWSVSDYLVNTDETLIAPEGELPEGWRSATGEVKREEEEAPEAVRVVVPPVDSLWSSPILTGEMLGPSPITFTPEEIAGMEQELEGLIPGYDLFRPRFYWGLRDRNLRFNRVEGLSVGASVVLPLTPSLALEPAARIGLHELKPRGSLALHRGPENRRLTLAGYRRLAHTSDFGDPLSLGASMSNLLLRNAYTHFYQTTGGELLLGRLGRRTRSTLRLFAEEHEAVERQTNFYLWRPFTGDTLPLNLPADEGSVAGIAADVRWQAGVDPARGVASGLLRGEVGEGDFSYQRGLATLAVSRPLLVGFAGALEVGAGAGWGDLPFQKGFFLGGPTTLRGYPGSFTSGEAFWFARGEVGTSMAVLRLTGFADMGWAGERDAWRQGKALLSAGTGISLLDGLIRADFAWPLREASGMRFYFYMDALF